MSQRKLPNDETVIALYESGKSMKQICREYGMSHRSSGNLSAILKRNGIEIRKDAGENHHGWKGGRIIKGCGYVGIWKPDHERADNQGYVYEHTLVIEKEFGRLPNKDEVVHHINLDKLDNSPNNLYLCNNKQHLVCHRSIEKLIKPLMDKGIIVFDNGEYKVNI